MIDELTARGRWPVAKTQYNAIPKMKGATMIIQIIRYKSGLTHNEINQRFIERSDRYRQVPGLLQKYYVRFTDTGEYGGVYVWDSPESLEAWRAGNLSGTISETYQIEGRPTRELAEVMLVLRGS